MITLLIIADDFTGALDTGVQFSSDGAVTRVVTDTRYDYIQAEEGVQVLVMDAETRHLDWRDAYEAVYRITKKAVEQGIPHIYKKTDSALRGNVGSELTALLDASGEEMLPFLPAFPKMRRVTRDGIHYVEGVPVSESVFGRDPFEPVTCSYIPDVIRKQSRAEVSVAGPVMTDEGTERAGIVVYDAQTDRQLEKSAGELYRRGRLRIMAGCAGFAAALPELLCLKGHGNRARIQRRPSGLVSGFLVVCGSVNPITVSQLDYAEEHGFARIRLTPQQKLEQGYWAGAKGGRELLDLKRQCCREKLCILDTNDASGGCETSRYAESLGIAPEAVRTGIAGSVGYLLKELVAGGIGSAILITGGDTLLGFMNQAGIHEMEPVCEPAPGTVLSRFRIGDEECRLLSKSGGFGSRDLLVRLAEKVLNKKEGMLC